MNYGTVDIIKTAAGVTPIPVASAGEVFTPQFNLYGGDAFGIGLIAVSDGVIDVLVQLQESMDGVNWVVPEGLPDIKNLTTTARTIKQVTPVPAKYGRFRLKGQGSNDASTTVGINFFRQEQTP